jgi:hypothetical protein
MFQFPHDWNNVNTDYILIIILRQRDFALWAATFSNILISLGIFTTTSAEKSHLILEIKVLFS